LALLRAVAPLLSMSAESVQGGAAANQRERLLRVLNERLQQTHTRDSQIDAQLREQLLLREALMRKLDSLRQTT
jgi:hypothetical protein